MSKMLSPKLMLLAGEPTHWCPGCKQLHRINVNAPNPSNGARWTWNQDVTHPTFSPSVHIVGYCHYFLQDGQLRYCGDSAHALAGQSLELPDLPQHVLGDWEDTWP